MLKGNIFFAFLISSYRYLTTISFSYTPHLHFVLKKAFQVLTGQIKKIGMKHSSLPNSYQPILSKEFLPWCYSQYFTIKQLLTFKSCANTSIRLILHLTKSLLHVRCFSDLSFADKSTCRVKHCHLTQSPWKYLLSQSKVCLLQP